MSELNRLRELAALLRPRMQMESSNYDVKDKIIQAFDDLEKSLSDVGLSEALGFRLQTKIAESKNELLQLLKETE